MSNKDILFTAKEEHGTWYVFEDLYSGGVCIGTGSTKSGALEEAIRKTDNVIGKYQTRLKQMMRAIAIEMVNSVNSEEELDSAFKRYLKKSDKHEKALKSLGVIDE